MTGRGIIGRRVLAFGEEWTVKKFYPARRGGFTFARYILARETPGRDWEMCVTRGALKFVRGNYTSKP